MLYNIKKLPINHLANNLIFIINKGKKKETKNKKPIKKTIKDK
jgi:hypothetical protein